MSASLTRYGVRDEFKRRCYQWVKQLAAAEAASDFPILSSMNAPNTTAFLRALRRTEVSRRPQLFVAYVRTSWGVVAEDAGDPPTPDDKLVSAGLKEDMRREHTRSGAMTNAVRWPQYPAALDEIMRARFPGMTSEEVHGDRIYDNSFGDFRVETWIQIGPPYKAVSYTHHIAFSDGERLASHQDVGRWFGQPHSLWGFVAGEEHLDSLHALVNACGMFLEAAPRLFDGLL